MNSSLVLGFLPILSFLNINLKDPMFFNWKLSDFIFSKIISIISFINLPENILEYPVTMLSLFIKSILVKLFLNTV